MWLQYLYKEIPKETVSDICRLNRTKGNILQRNHSSVGMIGGKVMSTELFEFQCLLFLLGLWHTIFQVWAGSLSRGDFCLCDKDQTDCYCICHFSNIFILNNKSEQIMPVLQHPKLAFQKLCKFTNVLINSSNVFLVEWTLTWYFSMSINRFPPSQLC